MLKYTIPVEKGNEAVRDGAMGPAIDALIEQVKPEAAYFMVEQGTRAGIIVFDERDQSRLPKINEPLFAELNAAIEIYPVLTLEDLRKGLG